MTDRMLFTGITVTSLMWVGACAVLMNKLKNKPELIR